MSKFEHGIQRHECGDCSPTWYEKTIERQQFRIAEQNAKIERLQQANDLLVQWKGEIDSRRIALDLPFPEDYDESAKYAVQSLIEALKHD